jgi:hypothetical protein
MVSGAPLAGVALAPWLCTVPGTCAKLKCPTINSTKMKTTRVALGSIREGDLCTAKKLF